MWKHYCRFPNSTFILLELLNNTQFRVTLKEHICNNGFLSSSDRPVVSSKFGNSAEWFDYEYEKDMEDFTVTTSHLN